MENKFYTDGQRDKFDLILEQNGVTPRMFQPALSTPVAATLAEAMACVDLTQVDIAALRAAYGLPKDLGLTTADFPLWMWVEYPGRKLVKDGQAVIFKPAPCDVELVRIFPQDVGLDYKATREMVIRVARRIGLSFCPEQAVEPLVRLLEGSDIDPAGYLVCAIAPNQVKGICFGREPGTRKMLAVIASDTGHHEDWSVIMGK